MNEMRKKEIRKSKRKKENRKNKLIKKKRKRRGKAKKEKKNYFLTIVYYFYFENNQNNQKNCIDNHSNGFKNFPTTNFSTHQYAQQKEFPISWHIVFVFQLWFQASDFTFQTFWEIKTCNPISRILFTGILMITRYVDDCHSQIEN